MSDRSDIVIILDRSGSMAARRADHEGGLRTFVRDARALAGDVRLTFVRFDTHDRCEVVFAERPVVDVTDEDIALTPRGGTPLFDAVGETLTRFAHLQRVVCMIVTDGEENESRKWKKTSVQDLVKAREAAGWKVLYLGANVDEFAEAGAVGIAGARTLGYADNAAGVRQMYRAVTQNYAATVSAASAGGSWRAATQSLSFTDAQRTAARADDDDNTAKTGASK